MIACIDTRLITWGLWSRMRLDGDRGLVAGFAYSEPELMRAPCYCSTPLLDDQCMLTDSAVAWLARRYAYLGVTVEYHYRDGVRYSSEQRARLLRISRRAYWYRIEAAHIEILGYFSERNSGHVPQLSELKPAPAYADV